MRAAEIRSGQPAGTSVLACEVADSTGELTAVFLGRARIAGLEPGRRIRLHGKVGIGADGQPDDDQPRLRAAGLARKHGPSGAVITFAFARRDQSP